MLADRTFLLFAMALPLFGAGCGTSPYKTSAPDEVTEQASTDLRNLGRALRKQPWQDVNRVQAVSFCYGGGLNTAEQVLEEAQYFCKGGTLRLHSQDVGLRRCALFQPHRVTYVCTPNGLLETSEAN